MIWGNLSGDDFLKKLRENFKKSSIESSKNHRFWWFYNHLAACLMKTKGKSQNRLFFDDFPQFFRKNRLNHQKIIDFGIFQSFCNMFNENQGKIPKSMIF